MYEELGKSTVTFVNLPPAPTPIPRDYQPIAENVLDSFPIETNLEELVLSQYSQFLEYHKKLEEDVQLRILRREEAKKQEMLRKAPGLSQGILEPTKEPDLRPLSPTTSVTTSPKRIDLSEFYSPNESVSSHTNDADDFFMRKSVQLQNTPSSTQLQNTASSNDQLENRFSKLQPFQTTLGPLAHFQQGPGPHYSSNYQPPVQRSWNLPAPQPSASTGYHNWHMGSQNPPPIPAKSLKDRLVQLGYPSQAVEVALQHYSIESDQMIFLNSMKSLLDKRFDFEASKTACLLYGSNQKEIDIFMKNVVIISEMGFSPSQASNALAGTNNNKDLALERLLS